MSITWNRCRQSTAVLLGAIDATTVATAETNYLAAQSTSVLLGPDFAPTVILDACVRSAMEIAQDICESAGHPEITSFVLTSSATASGATIPTASSGGTPRIGPIRNVKDSTNSNVLRETTVDAVRDFLAASATLFNGWNAYLFAIDGEQIIHTRTNVLVMFSGFTRATITANVGGLDIIPLNDEHEAAIINGAVAKLAPKETMYMALAQQCEQLFQAHRAGIRSYPKAAADGQK